MRIGFIGAGRVGFTLGKFLTMHHIKVVGYYSRSQASASEASAFTKSKFFATVEELLRESDIVFITVPDDEIFNTYLNIKNYPLKGKILCHCSGSLSSQIFSDIDTFSAYSYSIHPIFPISNKYESYKYINEAVFTIEGHDLYLDCMINLFTTAGVKVIPLENKDKSLYHLASVTVSNLFLALIKRSCSYLKPYGFSEADAVKALYPLIQNNIKNVLDKGLAGALTGPAERGDLKTIERHLEKMPSEHVPVYKALSKEIIEIAKIKNGDRDYSEILNLLDGGIDCSCVQEEE